MIDKVKNALKKLKDGKLYSSDDVHKMAVIVNTKLQPSSFTFYRLVESGKLPAVNLGAGAHTRLFVKGEDLKKYLKDTYKL